MRHEMSVWVGLYRKRKECGLWWLIQELGKDGMKALIPVMHTTNLLQLTQVRILEGEKEKGHAEKKEMFYKPE